MKIYTIFDDFDTEAADVIRSSGMELTVHPKGVPRPDAPLMKSILEEYDGVIIGTTQSITEEMFENINGPRIIATASIGLDHIKIPDAKKKMVRIVNTPKANVQSVAEYTFACALSCIKRLAEGNELYKTGRNNKALYRKPEDLAGKTIGVVGAGNISVRIMEYAEIFGMKVLCWTRNPDVHAVLKEKNIKCVSLDELAEKSDVISVNLPNNEGTRRIISRAVIEHMKETCIFISVSRKETVDIGELFRKANRCPSFYVCLDIDTDTGIVSEKPDVPNVFITPHIAGGTTESRKRMFREIAEELQLLNARNA